MSGRSPPLYYTLTQIAMEGHQKDGFHLDHERVAARGTVIKSKCIPYRTGIKKGKV